jgi:2'-5' RNA ligase
MNGETKRLFFAVNLPAGTRREIAEKIMPLIPKEGWRRAKEENLHVTMLFLGDVPEGKIARLKELAAGLRAFGTFEAEISNAGHFGQRVLWLGFGEGSEEFGRLGAELQAATGTHNEKFHAHVTIARGNGTGKNQAGIVAQKIGGKIKAMKTLVESIELVESRLGPGGPEYTVLFSVPLAKKLAHSR